MAQLYLGLAIEALGPEAASRWGAARDWIARAADAGLPEAHLRLAQIALQEGDVAQARASFAAAAEAGLVEAQFNRARLAVADQDVETAKRWYRRAASAGHGPSRFNLALLLLDSDAPDDAVDALAWLILAAEADAPNAAEARETVAAALSIGGRMRAKNMADARRGP